MHIHADLIDIAPVTHRSDSLIDELLRYDWSKAQEAYLNDTRGIWLPFLPTQQIRFNWKDHRVGEKEKRIIELTVPFLREIKTHFNNHRFLKGEIYNCPPKSSQDLHIDHRIFHRFCHRIHLPLLTNDGCFLQVGDERYHLKPYRIYEFNNMKPHGSCNQGDSTRIHIVVDLIEEKYANELSAYMVLSDFFKDSKDPGTDLDAYIKELKKSHSFDDI